MFKVTEEAKRELKRIHETKALAPGRCLGLAIPPLWTGYGDFGIVIDDENPGDVPVYLGDYKVLVIEDVIVRGIDDQKDENADSVLDFIESPEGSRFTLN